MHPDYYFLQVTEDGEILERLKPVENDMTARTRTFESGTHTITIDYSFLAKARQEETEHQKIFEVLLDGEEIQPCKRVWNKTYLLGTDGLGRDILGPDSGWSPDIADDCDVCYSDQQLYRYFLWRYSWILRWTY